MDTSKTRVKARLAQFHRITRLLYIFRTSIPYTSPAAQLCIRTYTLSYAQMYTSVSQAGGWDLYPSRLESLHTPRCLLLYEKITTPRNCSCVATPLDVTWRNGRDHTNIWMTVMSDHRGAHQQCQTVSLNYHFRSLTIVWLVWIEHEKEFKHQ